jgi:transcriptional regulator with GAF, ATPase, and Fis domain
MVLIGDSVSMRRVYQLISKVRKPRMLLTGETGTGKELWHRPFMTAASPYFPAIYRTKLRLPAREPARKRAGSGYRKGGAFTGADRDRKGLFAPTAPCFDEIGDMPLTVR